MNRRLFLKRSLLAAAGVASIPVARTLAQPRTTPTFTLRLVTDQPSLAIDRVSAWLKHSGLAASHIRFEEHALAGQHVGDMVLMRGQRLFNVWQEQGRLAQALRGIARDLELPRRLERPHLLTFASGGQATQAQTVNVFQGGILMHQLRLDHDRSNYEIEGTKGGVTLTVKERHVAIVGATCKHKTCMKLGAIHNPGESLVCVPNRITVTLDGSQPKEVDGVTF